MNVNTRTKKGVTLIELCVILAIILIVIAVIYPFFISNMKTLYETETRSDLQKEGQYAIKCFTDKAMEAQKIVELKDLDEKVVLSESDTIKLDESSTYLGEIEFTTPSMDGTTNSVISYCFALKDNSLHYKQKPSNNDIKVADNIQSIEIQTIDGKSFSECKGLNVKFTLRKNRVKSYTIESQVYFRNNPNNN